MTHEAVREKLLDLAYGELAPREAREVEAHAETCAECAAELARMRGTRAVMRSLPDDPAPDAGERILVAAAREAAAERARRRGLPRWIWSASAAAAVAVIVAGVSYRVLERRGPAPRDDLALLGSGTPPPPAAPPAPAAPAPAFARPPPASAPGTTAGDAVADRPTVAPERAAPKRAAPPRAAPERDAPEHEAKKARRAEPEEAPMSTQREEAPAAAPAPAEPRAAPEAPGARRSVAAAPSARAPSTAPPAPSAAPPAAEAAPAEAPGAPSAAPARANAAEAALARYESLRAAGRLRGAIRTFPGCAGEAWRKVETDPDGRVVSYVREGRIGGRSVRIEHLYAPDGALARVTARDADTGAPVDLGRTGIEPPRRAADAGLDAEPRCGP